MITKACLDCGRPTESAKRSRCRECERKRKGAERTGRLEGATWMKIRAKVLNQYGHQCAALIDGRRCEARTTLEVHHRNSDPSDNRFSNLVLLCHFHHRQLQDDGDAVFAEPAAAVLG